MALGGAVAVSGLLGSLLAFEPVAVAALDLASDYLSTRAKGRDKITVQDIDRIKNKRLKLDDTLTRLDGAIDDLADAIKDKVERDKET